MKKQIKEKVLEFMQDVDTSEFNSNKFIYEMYERYFGGKYNFTTGPSVESITRSRRKIIADFGIGCRTKADSEEQYIEEFGRQNKF